jgi:hypothetical protein
LLAPLFSVRFSADEFWEAIRLFRFAIFILEAEGVLRSTPGPTEEGRLGSCIASVLAVGSVGDLTVGNA